MFNSAELEALEAPGDGLEGLSSKTSTTWQRNAKVVFVVLLLLYVFEGSTHQVPRMATFGDRRLGQRIATATKGPFKQHRQDPAS